jgi:hypothetical protein
MRPRPSIGSLRGCLVGVMVGAFAVAAHGAAGGCYPTSTEAALVLLVAAVAGYAAATLSLARGPAGLLGFLAAGQLAGHCALSGLLGHGHNSGAGALAHLSAAALPADGMLAAHFIATLGGAALILLAERLYAMASSVIRAVLAEPGRRRITGPARWSDRGLRGCRFHPNGAIGPRAPPVPA